jgi:hypothetical protein
MPWLQFPSRADLIHSHCPLNCHGHNAPIVSAEFFRELLNLFLPLLHFLTFMGLRIVSIFQYLSTKMQRYTVYLYLETALGVVTPLLLPAAIVEELELVPSLPQ